MTPEDRQLISGLFDRMRAFGSVEKDGEAEALIRQSVQQNPDAAYMLVQSVLVQEHALQQADARIRDLEQQLQDAQTQQRAPAASGGFLGGLFGGGNTAAPRPQVNRGSVPPVGAARSGPMGAPARGPGGQPLQAGAQQPGGGGSFLQSAMATAAGVAGGMLLANGISSMLGGGSTAQASGATDATAQQASDDSNNSNTAGGDDNFQDASHDHDDSSDWGGGDMDFDI